MNNFHLYSPIFVEYIRIKPVLREIDREVMIGLFNLKPILKILSEIILMDDYLFVRYCLNHF